jgi:hypothetical protein
MMEKSMNRFRYFRSYQLLLGLAVSDISSDNIRPDLSDRAEPIIAKDGRRAWIVKTDPRRRPYCWLPVDSDPSSLSVGRRRKSKEVCFAVAIRKKGCFSCPNVAGALWFQMEILQDRLPN